MPNLLDENVVILRFDNSDFKKNTADSVKSLENLKSSLKSTESGEKLTQLGKAAKEIDLSGIGKSIDTVNKRFSLFGIAGMSVINNLTNSVVNSAKSIMTAVPRQMLQGGWTRALNIEQATYLMKGLGYAFEGTYDKITKEFTGVKGAVLAAVDDTAFGLDEAAKVAASFLASGVKGADELASRLKAVSGVAAVTSSDFSEVGRIFTQVAGQGRMMGDDLNQLSDKGFNAAQEIAKYLDANKGVTKSALDAAIASGRQVKAMQEISTHAHITESDVRQMISAGAISFDIMSDSLEHFFETAQEANKTYSGSFANVRAALSRMGAQIQEPKLQNMTRIFNTLLPILKKLEDFIKPFTDKINAAQNKVTDFINEGILNPIGKAIGVEPDKLFHGFAEEIKNVGNESVKTGNKTKDLGDKIRVTTKEWKTAIDIWNKGTYGTGQKRADAIRELGMSYENVQGIINRFYKNNFNWEKTKSQYSFGSKKQKEENEKTGKEAEVATDRLHEQTEELTTLGKVIKGVINFIKAFRNTMKALGNIVKVVWSSMKGMVSFIGGGLMSGFLKISEIVLDISERFLNLTKVLKKNGLEGLSEKAPTIAKALYAIHAAVSFVTGTFRSFLQAVGQVWSNLRSSAVLDKLAASFRRIGSVITNKVFDGFYSLTNRFREFFSFIGHNTIVDTVSNIFIKLIGGISNFIFALAGGERVVGSFFSALGAFANGILGVFEPIVAFLVDKFFGALETVFTFFKELSESSGVQALKNTILELADALFKTQEPLDNVVGGLGQLSGATKTGGLAVVVNFFSNIAQGLSDFINAIAKGTNPLEKFIDVFKKVKASISLGGVVDYLKSTVGFTVGKNVGPAVDSLADFAKKVVKFLKDIEIVKKLAFAAKTAFRGLETALDWIRNYDWNGLIQKIVSLNWEKIGKIGMYFAGILGVIKTASDMGKVAKSASGMFKDIGGMFKSFGSISETIKTQIKMKSFETLAMSIAILIGAIVALAMVPTDKAKMALTGVIGIMTALLGIMIVMNKASFDTAKLHAIGVAFAGVGVSVLAIATAMHIIAKLKVGEIIKAGAVITAFMILMAIIGKNAAGMAGAGAGFIGLAVALNLLATAIVAFAMIPFAMLLKGGAVIVSFMTMIAIASRIAGKSAFGGLVGMAVALNLLVPALVLLALIPTNMLIKGGAAVVGLMEALAIAARIAGGNGIGSIGKMAVMIAVLAAACLALSFIQTDRLIAAAGSISAMMIALGIASKAAEKNSSAIFAMTLVIAAIAGAIIALDKLAPERAVKIALSMSAMLVALAIAFAAFGKVEGSFAAAAKAGAAIDVMMGEIVLGVGAIVAGLALIKKGIDKVFGKGSGDKAFQAGLEMLEFMGKAIGGFFGSLTSEFVSTGPETKSVSEGFVDMVESLNDILSTVKEIDKEDILKFGEVAKALSDLGSADLKSALANFFGGGDMNIGTQMGYFTDGLKTLTTGIQDILPEDMEKAELASKIFAAFAHGAAEIPASGGLSVFWSFKSLKDFGKSMTGFGDSLGTFIDEMDQVPLTKLRAFSNGGEGGFEQSKLGLILNLLSQLTHADIPNTGFSIDGFLHGVKSLSGFGEEMAGFGNSMTIFIQEMDQVPLAKLQAFSNGGKGGFEQSKFGLILDLLSKLHHADIPETGFSIDGFLHGVKSLSGFGDEMTDFGQSLNKFVSEMNTVELSDLQAIASGETPKIKYITDIIAALSKAGAEIPPTGGVEQFINGTKDIGVFGSQIAGFAIGFNTLNKELNKIVIDDPDAYRAKIDAIVRASKSLMGIEPPTTGLIDSISKWAQMKASSGGISNMLRCIKQVGSSTIPDDIETKAADIAKASASLKDIKPPSDSFLGALKAWAISKIDASGISSLVDTLNAVSSAGNKIDTSGIAKFGTAVSTVKSSVKNLKGIGSIPTGANLVTLANNMLSFSRRMTKVETAGIQDKVDDVASAAKSMAKSTAAAASSVKGSSSSFSGAGASLASSLAKGMGKTAGVSSAAKKLVSVARGAIDTNALRSVGSQLSVGLAAGMRSALGSVRAAADELERQAERAVRAKAKVKSPSRVFMQIGAYIGEGFAIGIESYKAKVYRAGAAIAQESVDAANEALAGIDNFSSPVITPVLDLSDVRRDASQINSIVSADEALSVNSSMGAIPSNYATAGIVNQLLDKFDNMTAESLRVTVDDGSGLGTQIVNNITIDGAENPEDFANRFVNQMRMQMRTN